MDWTKRCSVIPDGCSTCSKMPNRYVEGFHPKEWEGARDAYCWADGKPYIDYTLGLGAVILGHSNQRIRGAIIEQYDRGTIYSLPAHVEGELAAQLNVIIPSAERVRFTNTGTEACMAAIKIARAYTGRERVLCCGYHGWASWYSAQSPTNCGCTQAEKDQIQSFVYNDLASLEKLFADGLPVAAVIMEPYVFESPASGFLEGVRTLCDKQGTVLIFDEVVTAFRTLDWTAQKHFGVIPDLTCVGKCMSNGVVPISAVCGKAELMKVISDGCFVSGTFAANPLACVAALETIKVIETFGVIQHLWSYGVKWKAHFDRLTDDLGLTSVKMKGQPCRTFFEFPTETHKSLFWQECAKNGIWLGYAQFISFAHQQPEMDKTVIAMKQALDITKRFWDEPEKGLEGKPAQATFRMTVGKEPEKIAPWKYRCSDCGERFDEPYIAVLGRYVHKPACPKCRRINLTR